MRAGSGRPCGMTWQIRCWVSYSTKRRRSSSGMSTMTSREQSSAIFLRAAVCVAGLLQHLKCCIAGLLGVREGVER
jgi:hypothetical protein